MSITLISTVTVGAGGAASIDFTSIPGTYTDLMVATSLRSGNGSNGTFNLSLNGVTTNRSYRLLEGIPTQTPSAQSFNGTDAAFMSSIASTSTANTFSNASIYIPNYAGATNKSFSVDGVVENNATLAYMDLLAGLWSNTAAITSLSLSLNAGSLVQYSTASLYGITKGSSGGVTVS